MNRLIDFILLFEAGLKPKEGRPPEMSFELARSSGFSDNPADSGGPTLCGITLATYNAWRARKGFDRATVNDLRAMPFAHWRAIFKSLFWDAARADDLRNRPLAYLLVDWIWASGPRAVRLAQQAIGITADGIIGPVTLDAFARDDAFKLIHDARRQFIFRIAKGKNIIFLRGWLNRLDAITHNGLILRNPPYDHNI